MKFMWSLQGGSSFILGTGFRYTENIERGFIVKSSLRATKKQQFFHK
jgi:hypothetical protein